MWDDFGNFLHGTGPTNTVLDADLNPNNILQKNVGGSVRVNWSFTGPVTALLEGTQFTVDLYAASIGPGPDMKVGSATVAGNIHTPPDQPGQPPPPPPWNYTATIAIPPNSLFAEGEGGPPGASGVYRLTTVISNDVQGNRDQLAGFVDGPVIEVRNP